MHNFRNMMIWKRSMELSKQILTLSSQFPKENRFDITSQIIRCSISIPSNIAEGSSRKSNKEFSMFLDYSIGSSHELETQLLLVRHLKLVSTDKIDLILSENAEIQKMLMSFKRRIQN